MNIFWTWVFRLKITIKIIIFINYKFDLPIVHEVNIMAELKYYCGNLSDKVST